MKGKRRYIKIETFYYLFSSLFGLREQKASLNFVEIKIWLCFLLVFFLCFSGNQNKCET